MVHPPEGIGKMLRKLWQRITASRRHASVVANSQSSRALLLEEIARLRAENRALLNSILGIAGIPPILVSEAEAAAGFRNAGILPAGLDSSAASAPSQKLVEAGVAPPCADKPESTGPTRVRFKSKFRAPRAPGATPQTPTAPRRRTWQQINRMLEFESARKKPQQT